MSYDKLAGRESIERAIAGLKGHNIKADFVETAAEAITRVLAILPKGAEVMTMSSETLRVLGLDKTINESPDYVSVRRKLSGMDRKVEGLEMQKLGAAPEWAIGSVHALTEDGKLLIASNTGSQLPAYAYGASHVIWVVGAQKIVNDLDDGFKRIYEYSLIKESERVKIAYGWLGSAVNKLLIINNEINPERLHVIIVNQVLGF